MPQADGLTPADQGVLQAWRDMQDAQRILAGMRDGVPPGFDPAAWAAVVAHFDGMYARSIVSWNQAVVASAR